MATAFIPEAQTLFTVTQATLSGRPAKRAACRAGAWPTPAWRTFPMRTSSTASGSIPARCTASWIAAFPRRGASTFRKARPYFPMGVLQALAMTTSVRSPTRGRKHARALFNDSSVVCVSYGGERSRGDSPRAVSRTGSPGWASPRCQAHAHLPCALPPELLVHVAPLRRGVEGHPRVPMALRPSNRLAHDARRQALPAVLGLRVHGEEVGHRPEAQEGMRLDLLEPHRAARGDLPPRRLRHPGDKAARAEALPSPTPVEAVVGVQLRLREVADLLPHEAAVEHEDIEVADGRGADADSGHAARKAS